MDASGWPPLRRADARDADGEPLWGPTVVCGAISRDDFLRWLERSDSAPPRWQFEPDAYSALGRVVVYSAPTLVHQRTASALVASIRDQVAQLGADPALEDALRPPASLVCRLDDQLLAPDAALVPAGAAKHRLPTLVVEVAYANEALAMLQRRLARWTQPAMADNGGVQIAIGVKVCAASPRRTILVLQRGERAQCVEMGGRARGVGGFGGGGWQPATAMGAMATATATATFPLGALFHGFALPPALRGLEREPILVDADDVRAVVQRALRTMKRRGGGRAMAAMA